MIKLQIDRLPRSVIAILFFESDALNSVWNKSDLLEISVKLRDSQHGLWKQITNIKYFRAWIATEESSRIRIRHPVVRIRGSVRYGIKPSRIRSTAYNKTRQPVDVLCRKLTCEDSQEADCFNKRLIIHQKVHEHGACKKRSKTISSCFKNAYKRHREGMVENA